MSTLESPHEQGVDGPGPVDRHTGAFDALGYRFAVTSDDARTISLVEEAFAVLAVCGPPSCWYHVRHHEDSIEVGSKTTTLGVVADCADVLSLLRGHVQRAAITAADADLVLRAGGVEHEGRTFVVGGRAGCGVSTLVAALVGEGCSYMSDDAVPVEMRTGKVRAFPQPILLDDRSLDLLPEIAALRSGLDRVHGRRIVAMRSAKAPPQSISRDVSVVLFPEHDDSGITMVQPVEADDTVVRLAEHAYNFPGHEQDAIEAIHWLVRGAQCLSVLGGDPHVSARVVMDRLASAN